jgi:phytoene dehydrogenase-like protein
MIPFPHPSHYNHMMMSTAPRVLIIGAGLAGLACASRLAQSGIACKVFEGSDDVGGRVRTDRVEGFQLDRGFQVFLTGYPEATTGLTAGGLAAQSVNILFQVCFPPSRLHAPVSPGVSAVSSRTLVNITG